MHKQDQNGKIILSDNVYKLSESNEQNLINLMFAICMRVYDFNGKEFKTRDDLANWIRYNLSKDGFEVKRIGMSFATLMKIEINN